MPMRLVLPQKTRDEAHAKAKEAVYYANDRHDPDERTKLLIEEAVDATIDYLEVKLA